MKGNLYLVGWKTSVQIIHEHIPMVLLPWAALSLCPSSQMSRPAVPANWLQCFLTDSYDTTMTFQTVPNFQSDTCALWGASQHH